MKAFFAAPLGALLMAVGAVPSLQAQQTKILTADRSNDYGLVYTLPMTALHVELTARRTVSKPGPYYQYAKKYLGTADVVAEQGQKWEIVSAEVSTYGVADPETQYLMQLKPGSNVSICVDPNGMLLGINTKAKGQEPWQRASEQSVASVAPHIEPGRDFLEFVGEDFVASQSLAKQAEMLAESLMEVRDTKLALTRNTADPMPTDGRQLELMLSSLEKQEQALTAAFTGVEWTETFTRSFDAVPEGNGSTVICRLSDFGGLVDASDLTGDPVTLEIEIVSEGTLPVDASGQPKRVPKDAVIYCIPGSANVVLSARGEKVFENEFRFGQFGVDFGLNPTLFTDRKEPYRATFDPVTGALLEVSPIPQE